jgi:thiamine-phosphate pyrophosphorylase
VVVYRRMSVQRVIDSSSNRLAEALRVMEDLARFNLDDAGLVLRLKEIRHESRAISTRWPQGWAASHRDTNGDVGTRITTTDEMHRNSLWDVGAAAGNRAAEALRTLEEITKTFDVEAAAMFEGMRYRLYELDACLRAGLASRQCKQWSICLLLTESCCRSDWYTTATEVIEAGIDCIQLREKDLPDRVLVERAKRLVDLARPAGCSVVINDRLDVALAADADGVHLGQGDLSIEDARRHSGGSLFIGVSTHNDQEADDAVQAGADNCGVGPIYAGNTRPDLQAAGVGPMASFIDRHPNVPHLAIGGITPERLPQLLEAGCRGVAICDAICAAPSPGDMVRRCRAMLESAAPASP